MKRTVRLTERDLTRIVKRIINENVPFQQGQKVGAQTGQKVQKAVVNAGVAVLGQMKQTAITIAKVTFYAIAIPGVIVFMIGKSIYRTAESVGLQIIRFISSTGIAIVKAATALGGAIATKFDQAVKIAGIQISNTIELFKKSLLTLKDESWKIVRSVISYFKNLGVNAYAKVLVMASKIAGWGSALGAWFKNTWGTIQNQIGVAWDKASSWASGAIKSVQSGVKAIGDGISNAAGTAYGFAKGLFTEQLCEMIERYLSFEGTTFTKIISESQKFNLNRSILY